jgi:VWFA-related protein
MTRVLVSLALGSAVLAAAPPSPPAQPAPPQTQTPPQQPVFRARLETVAVPVTVFSPEGELVTSLTRDDFKVFDEGDAQEITNFTNGLQPVSAVVLVDTSASMTTSLERARYAAEQFIIRMRPGDQARVGTFNDIVNLGRDFTGDRDALLKDLQANHRFANPTRLFDAVDEAMTSLTPLGGRRVVVALTDGCDTGSKTHWDALRRRFMSEEVMLYMVQFRPRIRPPQQQQARSLRNPCDLHVLLELKFGTPIKDFFNMSDPRVVMSPVQVLDRMSTETGGGRVILLEDDDVGATFTRISNELHYLYLLGFTPQKRDGKSHELVVRVADQKMSVRARRRYLAPLDK